MAVHGDCRVFGWKEAKRRFADSLVVANARLRAVRHSLTVMDLHVLLFSKIDFYRLL